MLYQNNTLILFYPVVANKYLRLSNLHVHSPLNEHLKFSR